MNDLRLKLATDPVLIFAKDIMYPDAVRVVVPERLRPLLDGDTTMTPNNYYWLSALQPIRRADRRLTSEEQIYRTAFKYMLDFLEEAASVIEFTCDHKKCYDWLYRWLYLLTCPIRWYDPNHAIVRAKLRTKLANGHELSQEEANEFNDHGIYQSYGIYERFILYHNPKVWDLIKSFRLASASPQLLSFVSLINDSTVKIDRRGELYHTTPLTDYRGLWRPEQRTVYASIMNDNARIVANDFYPPLILKDEELDKSIDVTTWNADFIQQ